MEPQHDDARCTGTIASGERCRHTPEPGTATCRMHRPDGASRGGRPRKQGPLAVDLTTPESIAATLNRTAQAVARGEINAAGASAITKMASLALKALDTEWMRRLEEIEEKLNNQPKSPRR